MSTNGDEKNFIDTESDMEYQTTNDSIINLRIKRSDPKHDNSNMELIQCDLGEVIDFGFKTNIINNFKWQLLSCNMRY